MSIDTVASFVDENEVVNLTRQLVSIPSVYNPEVAGANEERVARFLQSYLKGIGLEVHYEEVVPGRPNLIAIFDSGKPGRTLLFEGHTDVVTAGDKNNWSYDPFGAAIANGRIYGRGSCDTKGNLAAAISAVQALKRSGDAFSGKVLLCIPCDEEGMMLGIKDFVRRGWAKGVDGAIICEPEENQICVSQKGAMRVVIKAFGKMAHGAMPLSGINPNTRMARIIVALEELERQEKERVGENPFLGWPSITPTILRGPVSGEPQINVVPDQCLTALDIRTVPGQEHDTLRQQIEDILQRLSREDKDFRAEMEVIEERPWTETDRNHPVVAAVAESYQAITGRAPVYNGVPGATDGTYLHMAGVPIITTGAGDRLIPHHVDEFVDIAELVEATQMYARSALRFLSE